MLKINFTFIYSETDKKPNTIIQQIITKISLWMPETVGLPALVDRCPCGPCGSGSRDINEGPMSTN